MTLLRGTYVWTDHPSLNIGWYWIPMAWRPAAKYVCMTFCRKRAMWLGLLEWMMEQRQNGVRKDLRILTFKLRLRKYCWAEVIKIHLVWLTYRIPTIWYYSHKLFRWTFKACFCLHKKILLTAECVCADLLSSYPRTFTYIL